MESQDNQIKFKTLATFDNTWSAEVVKSRLNAEGIEAFLIDSNINYSFGPTNVERYRLQVFKEDFEKALNIYKNSLED